MTDPHPVVLLEDVSKSFGHHKAVSDLDLQIPAGSIYGLLGPNGSGKTTTIRMIMGILIPDSGAVQVFGERPDNRVRRRVGYLPEERGLYRRMAVLDQLQFLGELRGLRGSEARTRARGWLERMGLEEWADRRVQDLSKGMQQKVQFIGTVLHDPELLILDEPFSGLDPINQQVLEEIVRDLNRAGTTVLFSTHLMDHAERLCDSVCLISRSRKVLDGELAALKRAGARGVVALEFDGDRDWVDGPEVNVMEPAEGGIHVLLSGIGRPQALLERAIRAGVDIHRFEIVQPSLHEIFIEHAGADPSGGPEDDLPEDADHNATTFAGGPYGAGRDGHGVA